MARSGRSDAQDLRATPAFRARRAWTRVRHFVSPLRRRFALLLLLLCSLLVVPWGLAVDMHDDLDGLGQELDLAGSVRKRLLELELAVIGGVEQREGMEERIEELDTTQQEALTHLIEGDPQQGLSPCREEVCETLSSFRTHWTETLIPLARRAAQGGSSDRLAFHRAATNALIEIDRTVHNMAQIAESRIDGMMVAGGLATLGALVLVTLVAIGVAVAIEEVRRVERASRDSVNAVAHLGGGHDEIAALARTLADSMHALEQEKEAAMIAELLEESVRHARLAELLATMPDLRGGADDLALRLHEVVPYDVAILHVSPKGEGFAASWRLDGATGTETTGGCSLHHTDAMHQIKIEGTACTALTEDDLEAAVEVPLRTGERLTGLLVLVRRTGAFSEQELASMRRLGPVLASALDRMRLERMLRANEQAAALAGITRMVAHEVRNPLNSLGLHAQLLERRLDRLPPTSREMATRHIRILRAEVMRLDSLVREYLSLSPGRVPDLVPLDLREVIDEVRSVLSPQLSDQQIDLGVEITADHHTALADRSKLVQVMHNLVRNAAEAMAGTRANKEIIVGLREPGGHLELFVRDNGPGLKDLEEIFLPSYTTKAAGTGMGLAISRRIAELMGGTLEARRPAGGGAELVLSLPALSDTPAAAAG